MSHLGKRLSALVDGELDGEGRERVLGHLARCEPCREEAATLRMLKQRMRALGETTAGEALTERLMAMGGQAGLEAGLLPVFPGRPGPPGRSRRPLWTAAAAVVALAVGLPVAGFALGGAQQIPGPQITPAVDVFMVQHAITTGNTPARYGGGVPSPRPADPAATAANPGRDSARAGSPRRASAYPVPAQAAPTMAGPMDSSARPSTRAVPARP